MLPWITDPAIREFQCVKCRKLCLACIWESEGFMQVFHEQIENDNTRVEAVCGACFQKHFAKYERHKP